MVEQKCHDDTLSQELDQLVKLLTANQLLASNYLLIDTGGCGLDLVALAVNMGEDGALSWSGIF